MRGFREPFHNFQEPVTFPHDEKQQRKTYEDEAAILVDFVDQRDPVSFSYPSLLFLIETVASSKCADFPERVLSPLSAQKAISDGPHGEIHRQADGNDPSENDRDVQHQYKHMVKAHGREWAYDANSLPVCRISPHLNGLLLKPHEDTTQMGKKMGRAPACVLPWRDPCPTLRNTAGSSGWDQISKEVRDRPHLG